MPKARTYSKKRPVSKNAAHLLFDDVTEKKQSISTVFSPPSSGPPSSVSGDDGEINPDPDSEATEEEMLMTLSEKSDVSATRKIQVMEQHPRLIRNGTRMYGAPSGHLPSYRPVKSPRINANNFINLSPDVRSKKTFGYEKKLPLWGCDSDVTSSSDTGNIYTYVEVTENTEITKRSTNRTTQSSDTTGNNYTYIEVTENTEITKQSTNRTRKSSGTTESAYMFEEVTVLSDNQDSSCEKLRKDVVHRESSSFCNLFPEEKGFQHEKQHGNADSVLLLDCEELPQMPLQMPRLNSTLMDHCLATDLHDYMAPSNISPIADLKADEQLEWLDPENFKLIPELTEKIKREEYDENENNRERLEKTPSAKPKTVNRKAFKLKPKSIDKQGKLQPKSSTFMFPEPENPPTLVLGDDISVIPTTSMNPPDNTPSKFVELSAKPAPGTNLGLVQNFTKRQSCSSPQGEKPKATSTPVHQNILPLAMITLSPIGIDQSSDEMVINMSAFVNSDEIMAMDTDEEEEMASANKIIKNKPSAEGDMASANKMASASKMASANKIIQNKPFAECEWGSDKENIPLTVPRQTKPTMLGDISDDNFSPYTHYMKSQQRKILQKKTSKMDREPKLLPPCCITTLLEKYPNYPGPRKVKVMRRNLLLHTAPDDFLENF